MEMTLFQGFVQLGAGLSVGLAGLAAGFAIGVVGDAGVRGTAQQPRLFVGMVSVLRQPHRMCWTGGCKPGWRRKVQEAQSPSCRLASVQTSFVFHHAFFFLHRIKV